ncbi:hypothetical protein SPFM20_00236 [Salmonella phage SPFM20]|nr:hypothetical protein SPFM8_00236 [Salmonella phage SPFM8]VFR14914.1 hypothetical protein SPFM20_00236 [Salmonella phage SPFM20]
MGYIDVRTEDGVVNYVTVVLPNLKPLLLEQTEGKFATSKAVKAYLDSVIDNIIIAKPRSIKFRSEMAVFDARYEQEIAHHVGEQIFDGNGQPIPLQITYLHRKGDPKIDPATGIKTKDDGVTPEYTYDPDAVPDSINYEYYQEDVLAYWEKDVFKIELGKAMSYYWRKARAVTEMDTMIVPPARDGIGITHEITEYNVFYGCTGYYPGNYERAIINNTRITTEVDVDTPAPLLERVWEFLLKTNLDVDRNDELRNADGKLAYINGTLVGRQGSEPPYQALSDDQVFAQISFSPADYQIEKTAEGYILRTVTKSQLNSKRFVSTNVTTELSVVTYVVDINNKSCDVRIYQLDKPRKEDLVNAGNTNRYLFTPFHRFTDTSLQIDAEMTILAKTMKLPTVRINGNRLTIEPDTL